MADDEIKARTFRIPATTNNRMKELGKLFSKNDTEVLIRAIDYLYENGQKVAEEDFKQRLNALK